MKAVITFTLLFSRRRLCYLFSRRHYSFSGTDCRIFTSHISPQVCKSRAQLFFILCVVFMWACIYKEDHVYYILCKKIMYCTAGWTTAADCLEHWLVVLVIVQPKTKLALAESLSPPRNMVHPIAWAATQNMATSRNKQGCSSTASVHAISMKAKADHAPTRRKSWLAAIPPRLDQFVCYIGSMTIVYNIIDKTAKW
jgi:hypothetical protein